jgi:hypothetical protein
MTNKFSIVSDEHLLSDRGRCAPGLPERVPTAGRGRRDARSSASARMRQPDARAVAQERRFEELPAKSVVCIAMTLSPKFSQFKDDLRDETLLPEHLVHQRPDAVDVLVADLDEAGAGRGQELAGDRQAVRAGR